jgi:hypothetical protein
MLSIVDLRNGLWTIFTMAGEVVRTHRRSGGVATRAAFSPAHQALLSAVRGRSAGDCSPPEILATGVIDGVTSRLATVLDAPTGGNDDCPQNIYSFDAGPAGGFVVGFGSPDYILQEYGQDGSLVREIRHEIDRVPKTMRELAAERAASQQGRVPGVSRDVEPTHLHFYGDAIRYDTDGRIWVRTPRGRQEATLFDVFENGTLLTTVAVPVITRLKGHAFSVGGHYLLVVGQDDSSNPTLHLFRVKWN